jgi:hypothetical protein
MLKKILVKIGISFIKSKFEKRFYAMISSPTFFFGLFRSFLKYFIKVLNSSLSEYGIAIEMGDKFINKVSSNLSIAIVEKIMSEEETSLGKNEELLFEEVKEIFKIHWK